jgi:hypothetical protein
LVQLDLLVLPPFLPVVVLGSKIVTSDGNIADWRIEPYIEHFVFELFLRNRRAPFEVTSDTSASQAFLEQVVREVPGITAPLSCNLLLIDPCFELGRDLG